MPAEEAYVLSPTDVRNIRNYVKRKYASMPHGQRAEIVADAVARIIHKQLPDFELQVKRELTAMLIRTTVLEEQRPVRADDIYKLSLSLDQSDPLIAEPLQAWLREQKNRLMGGAIAAPAAGEVIKLPRTSMTVLRRKRQARMLIYGMLNICLITAAVLYSGLLPKPSDVIQPPVTDIRPFKQAETGMDSSTDGLPAELRYAPVNEERLTAYLNSKSSMLVEPQYFEAIIDAAEMYDIHPVLLFAITGQEQGFVPKTNRKAEQIANNPFNVFHSWQEFNTDIRESAEIAARTIVRLSKDKPEDVDPYTWINREYAEDPRWSEGVRSIFASIMRYLEAPQHREK